MNCFERLSQDAKVRNYNFEDLQFMVEALTKRNMKYKHLKLYVLFLAPLMVGDNLDSYYNRPGSKPGNFVKALLKMVRE